MTETVPPLPEPQTLREEKVSIRDFRLHLRIWGDPSKPLILLQHGGKDHGRSWDWTVAGLLDRYCCAVPDLRGHGDSDWSPGGSYDTMDYVSDLSAIVDHLVAAGFEPPFHFIGHSLGGNIVLNYAAAQPERIRTVTSIEGLGFSQASYDELTARPAAERMGEFLDRRRKVYARPPRIFRSEEEGARRMRTLHERLAAFQAEHLARHALQPVEGGFRWKHDPLLGVYPVRPVPPAEYGEVFAAITAPTMLLYGAESWASNPEKDGRLAAFRHHEFHLFDKAGHWLHHDRFRDFMALTRRFLEAHS